MSKTLQAVGGIALLLWTGLGLFAWSQVGAGLEVVLQEPSSGEEELDAALEADRLAVLSEDLDALVGALELNFTRLAEELGRQGDVQAVESARTLARLEALEDALPRALHAREVSGALDSTLARLERLEDELGGLAARLDAGELAARVAPPVVTPVEVESGADLSQEAESHTADESVEPVAESSATDSNATDSNTTEPAAPDPPEVTPEPAQRKSFLAFDLPSRTFEFEGPKTFEVLGELSRVGFDAKSTLHDFTGVSERVSGSFQVDLAHAEAGISGRVEAQASSLRTGMEDRDAGMFEHLETETYETLSFEPSKFEPDQVDAEAMQLSGTLHGTMTIHGVARELALRVEARVDDSKRLVVEGETPLVLSDYGVEVPSKLGVISMEDEVRIWLRLRARARVTEGGR